MDINTAATLGTLVAVLAALVFGVLQVRQTNKKARNQTTWDILSSFLDPDMRRAYPLVRDLPDDCDPDLVRGNSELRHAAETIDFFYEGHGMMVDRGAVSLAEFDSVLGGSCRMCWRKLRRYINSERARSDNNRYGEWFEYLVRRLETAPGGTR